MAVQMELVPRQATKRLCVPLGSGLEEDSRRYGEISAMSKLTRLINFLSPHIMADMPNTPPESDAFGEKVFALRALIKDAGEQVHSLKGDDWGLSQADGDNSAGGEIAANIMLAYRHLEDSSMRLGKVMQAKNGGVSILTR